ncbi:11811_t:CDS:1, partial [Ambispora leptoticha]
VADVHFGIGNIILRFSDGNDNQMKTFFTVNLSSASTSTSVTTTGNDSVMLTDEIKKYKTKGLVDFLSKEGDLKLEEEDLEISRK